MPKTVYVPIHLIDETTVQFPTDKTTTGTALIETICKSLGDGIPETHFFGVQFYKVKKQHLIWLNHDKKVWDDLKIKRRAPVETIPHCRFLIRFYPEDVTKEIDPYSLTLKYLYLQIKDLVQTNILACSEELKQELKRIEVTCSVKQIRETSRISRTSVSFNESMTFAGASSSSRTAPGNINAMLSYLEISQKISTFGFSFWDGKEEKDGRDVVLGVHATGLSIHDSEIRSQIHAKLDWSTIHSVSANDRKLMIKRKEKEKTLVYFSPSLRTNKEFLKMAMGNHVLYMKRHNLSPVLT